MDDVIRRPRLLFLCQTLPYPPDGGVWIRTYHVLRLLADAFDITALCFERAATSGTHAEHPRAGTRDGLGRLAAVEVFPIPQRHSRIRFSWDHIRSAALRRVYTAFVYDSRAFHRRLTELLRTACSSAAFGRGSRDREKFRVLTPTIICSRARPARGSSRLTHW